MDLKNIKPDSEINLGNKETLLHYMRLGKKKEEMFSALQSGSGMKGILNIAYTWLENPMVVCDTSFSILENCPAHENNLDFEIRNGKQYMRPESVLSMRQNKIVERLLNETTPFVAYREELNCDMMYCRIEIQRNFVGYICLLSKKRAFTDDDMEIMAALAQMLSVEMQKSSFFTEKTGFKHEYFLTNLMEGNIPDEDFIMKCIIQLGRRPLKNYWILAAMFEDKRGIHINHQFYSEQLATILHNSMAFFYKGNIIMLVSSDTRKVYESSEHIKLAHFLQINHMYLAVSHSFTVLTEASDYYHQTTVLLDLVKTGNTGERILNYEDYMAESMGLYLKRADRESAVHPDLKLLLEYDRQNHAEYFLTLKVYLENDRNAVRSAQALHIHKSTFFYRMGKICEMLDIRLDDSQKLFAYELSLRLMRIEA